MRPSIARANEQLDPRQHQRKQIDTFVTAYRVLSESFSVFRWSNADACYWEQFDLRVLLVDIVEQSAICSAQQ